MVLGLSGDVWAAIGSIAALLGLPLSVWGLRRRSTASNAPAQGTPKDVESTPAGETLKGSRKTPMNQAPTSIGLRRINSGIALLNLIGPAGMYQFDHEEPATAEEAKQIADALRTVLHLAEADNDVGPGDRVRAGFELTGLIEELERIGWTIYAAMTPRQLVIAEKAIACPMATIHIARTRNAKAA